MQQKQMGLAEWGMLLILSLLWGGSFLFNGILVKALPPFTIVTGRVLLAAIALNMIVRLMGHSMPRDGKSWVAFFGMGVLNNMIPFCLIVWGQTHIASGLASILNATTPLFTVVVAHVLTADEKMTGNRLIGVLVGFAGVAYMIGFDVLHDLGSNVLAQFAVLGAAVSYSFAGIWGRRFRAMGMPPLLPAAGQVTASTILMLPIALIADRPWALACSRHGDLAGALWSCPAFDGDRLCAFLPYSRNGGCDEPGAGDFPDSRSVRFCWARSSLASSCRRNI